MSLSIGSGLLGGDDPGESVELAGRFGGGRLLVPVLAPEMPAAADQVRVAATLARADGAPLSVVTPVPAPEASGVESGDDDAALGRALGRVDDRPDGEVVHTNEVVGTVLRTTREEDVDTVVIPGGAGRVRGRVVRGIAAGTGCDVLVVNGRAGYADVASVLLPVADGDHAGLAADIASRIAADTGAWVDVLHVVPEDATERRRERAASLLADASRRIGRPETTTTWTVESDDVAGTIVDQSRCYDVTVVGAPTKGRLRRFIGGSTTRDVRANAGSVVLSARTNRRSSAPE